MAGKNCITRFGYPFPGQWASLFLILAACLPARGQKKMLPDHDSTYYRSYRDQLVGRLYLSRKYTSVKMTSPEASVPVMKYLSNSTLNLGIGATYRSLTLNLGFGISSFNPDNERGKTQYFDLQAHFYARKWNYDFFGQFYTGFYLYPEGLGKANKNEYYIRPDFKVQMGGIAAYRALNARKFSYQAGLVQNEWQQKSAGSFLIGAETYFGNIHGDSTLAPSLVDPSFAEKGIHKIQFLEIGPGAGYAYTLVMKKHYFILGSVSVNLSFRYAREIASNQVFDNFDFTPKFLFHAGMGYNSEKWDLSVLWVASQVYVRGPASDYQYRISSGNYRLIFARRFSLNRKVKKVLQPINNLIEWP